MNKEPPLQAHAQLQTQALGIYYINLGHGAGVMIFEGFMNDMGIKISEQWHYKQQSTQM